MHTALGAEAGSTQNGGRSTLGFGLATSRSAAESQSPCLCIETSCVHHNLQNVSWSLPFDTGQVFCGNSLQDIQVQQSLHTHTNWLRHVQLSRQLHLEVHIWTAAAALYGLFLQGFLVFFLEEK